MEGKGTTNAIYILQSITERVLEQQKEVYLYLNISHGHNTEIALRIAQTKLHFQRLKSVQTNKYIPIHIRRALEDYIELILIYVCEALTI